ncbi:WPP domain-associated protein [Zea mays]|uniref:WPP domain-associated protein n=1 Tax=Zea mays TaxID=4577 RepID=A0A1D6MWD9_MAIZE|nr:WPP domain-associated protein [Zea mays]
MEAAADLVSEITALRDELRDVLCTSEPATHHHHHRSHGSLEDETIIAKTEGDSEPPVTEKSSESTLEIPDFSLLKHMHGEEITSFLRTEWLKLRRQHESELHEKTEELFRVKREHAKEKASLPLKKERELELHRSKLLQTIARLGEIASRKEESCSDCNEDEEMCRLKDRIGVLLQENNRLRGLLADKKQEVKHLSLQVSDSRSKIAQYSLPESKLSNNCEKLRAELEDFKIERHLNDLLDSSVFREVCHNYEDQICDLNQEGSFLRDLLDEKEDQLSIMYEDRQKLKHENDQLVSIAGSIIQHHDQANLVHDELMIYKEKLCEQELLILESKGEYNSMKRCLYEAMQQIQKAKEQNASLDATIREMKKTPGQSIGSHWGQTGEFDLTSMEKLSKTCSDFESRLVETMKRNETRCVDVLGDEVDTLLSVLGKIYIALDHYSPVLKHYPGVTEILMLVQKVLKGESV